MYTKLFTRDFSLPTNTTAACCLLLVWGLALVVPLAKCGAEPLTAGRVVADRCLVCHDEETKEGGIDLSVLSRDDADWHEEKTEKLWLKVEASEIQFARMINKSWPYQSLRKLNKKV